MLKRIQKIQNIGRFADCNLPGCEFAPETIAFGFNTQGKSTLTAILRSIQTGNNNILIGRKTFGATAPKKVEVDFEENSKTEKYIFQNKAWNKSNPNICIFDSKFISENIFEGDNVSFDQQKNLNSIIVGEPGKKLSDEIFGLQGKSNEYTEQKGKKTIEFSQHFSEYDLDKFRKLTQDKNIDKKLAEKEKEINFEKNKTEIERLLNLHLANLGGIDFSIKKVLQKTFDTKQQEIDDHIKAHFSTVANAKSFLSEGLPLLKQKPLQGKRSCIFCGQELNEKAENLIDLYATFFKSGYEQLQEEVNNASDYFTKLNVALTVTKLASDLTEKGIDIGLTEEKIKQLSQLKTSFEVELTKKRNLNYAINFKDFDTLEDEVSKLKMKLEDIKQQKIKTQSSKTLLELENEKQVLLVSKKRFEEVWVKFCDSLNTIEAEAEKVRKLREEKRGELESYSSAVFDTYKKTINYFCVAMCADFEIEDFKPLKKIVGQDERIFAIKFFGAHKVNIDPDDEQLPSFKNTLSESDKRILAFAFFLSTLAHDKDLNKKIVVFDDPMASFDSERRRTTSQLITDIECKYKDTDGTEKTIKPCQKIILTHEERFAKDLIRLMPAAAMLKIEEYMDGGNKRSKIVRADFLKDFPDDETIDKLEKLKKILDSRQFSVSFETDCRIVLENIFKRKYLFDLKDEITNKKSVRTFVDKLKELKISGFEVDEKYNKFIRLCDDLNIESHDSNAQNTNGNKGSILKDFFECLKQI